MSNWWDYLIGRGQTTPTPAPVPVPPPPPPPPVPAPVPVPPPPPAPIPEPIPEPLPEPPPEPTPAPELFDDTELLSITGPLHPMFISRPGPKWQFMDTANSSSIRVFHFSRNPRAIYLDVQFLMVWSPINANQKARLCYAYTNAVPQPEDWIEIARIDAAPRSPGPDWPPGWSVRPDTTNEGNAATTAFFTRVAEERRDVYVGWQIWGDFTPMELCECRLTFWKQYK